MSSKKKWYIYMMLKNHKVYLRKSMTTMETIKWITKHCKIENTNYFLYGKEVFCECK